MKIENNIEFQTIRQELSLLCQTARAREMVAEIHFLYDLELIETLLEQSYQMRNLLAGVHDFPFDNCYDLGPCLQRLRVQGTSISQEDLRLFLLSYSTIGKILSFLEVEKDKADCSAILKLCKDVCFDKAVLKECSKIIDTDGEIKESCSPVLRDIRQRQSSTKKKLGTKIQTILSKSKDNGWTNSEDDVTIRNGSLVIPVKSSYKRQIKGILHDSSQTGQTFYIEPEEIVEINFELKELDLLEQQEIHRILLEFSDLLRQNLDSLQQSYQFLVQTDFLRAKSLYALSIGAGKPELLDSPTLDWYEARHPLLEKSLKSKGQKIIPLNIRLSEQKRILIISGPNAGGKSVCLKTLALLQYMLQCGLLIPVKEISRAGIFDNIFLSIGDSQSLENDLSTYSSHLLQMKEICEQADKDSLFLIDECGSGTDPQMGGAISESILEYLDKVKSRGVVTTHYPNLKHLPMSHPNMVNGAMLFDTDKMVPLFTLSIGTPGSSFAFEIARRIGLDESVINAAKDKVGSQQLKFEQELQQIEVEKLSLQEQNRRMKDYDDTLYETISKYRRLEEKLSVDKNRILDKARQEAKDILSQANRKIENVVEQIRKSNAEKQQVKQAKKEIEDQVQLLQQQSSETKILTQENSRSQSKSTKSNLKFVNSSIEPGDYVVFGNEQTIMEVKSIGKNSLELTTHNFSLRTSPDKVQKIDKQSYLKQKKGQDKTSGFGLNPIMDRINTIRSTYKSQIDLRGERAEDAIKAVSNMIDTARLLGESRISILHGKGDGILKVLIRDYLRELPQVKTFYPERVEFGGEGITIVELN